MGLGLCFPSSLLLRALYIHPSVCPMGLHQCRWLSWCHHFAMVARSMVHDLMSSGWVGDMQVYVRVHRQDGPLIEIWAKINAIKIGKYSSELFRNLGPWPCCLGAIQTFPPLLISHWLITNTTQLELALKCLPQAITDWVNLLPVRHSLHTELPHLFSFLSLQYHIYEIPPRSLSIARAALATQQLLEQRGSLQPLKEGAKGTRAQQEQIYWAAKEDRAPHLTSPIPRHKLVLLLHLQPHPHHSHIQLSGSTVLSREDTRQCKRKDYNSHKDEKLCITGREEVTRTLGSSSSLCPLSQALQTCSHAVNIPQRRASPGHEFCPCTSFSAPAAAFQCRASLGRARMLTASIYMREIHHKA